MNLLVDDDDATQFQYVIRRDPAAGKQFGLSLVVNEKAWVSQVLPGGLIDIKNAKLADVDNGVLRSQTIQIGDVIRMINGTTHPTAICDELMQQNTLHMWVDRLPRLRVCAEAAGLPNEPLPAPCAPVVPSPCPQPWVAPSLYAVPFAPPAPSRIDGGGNFVVLVDYDPRQEHELGYLSLRQGQRVSVFPNTRQAGEPYNMYREYVFAESENDDERGWTPVLLLGSKEGSNEDQDIGSIGRDVDSEYDDADVPDYDPDNMSDTDDDRASDFDTSFNDAREAVPQWLSSR